jgi:hypothetical protein
MAKTEDKKPSTEVAAPASTGLAVAPEFMDAGDFEGAGFEGADKDSYAIPFIQILQKMSPMVDEDDPKHIDGAKAGMLYNTVTQKLTDGKVGLLVVPCYYKRSYVLWGGREGDGGFKGEVTPEEFDAVVKAGKIEVVDGKPLVKDEKGEVHPKKSDYYADTRSHYVLVIDPETKEIGQAIVSLASSQIKASKMLLTALSQKKVQVGGVMRTPPTFANIVKMTTIGLSNDKGSWSGAKFELDGMVTDANLYAAAKDFYKAILDDKVKVDRSKDASAADGEVSGEAAKADEF